MYLLFTAEQDAWDRSEQEGIYKGLSYHTKGKGTRYVTAPQETTDGQWALDVTDYELDDVEAATTVESVTFPNYEDEEV